ncbi:MAG: YidB family protein [Aestuariivirga sp.]
MLDKLIGAAMQGLGGGSAMGGGAGGSPMMNIILQLLMGQMSGGGQQAPQGGGLGGLLGQVLGGGGGRMGGGNNPLGGPLGGMMGGGAPGGQGNPLEALAGAILGGGQRGGVQGGGLGGLLSQLQNSGLGREADSWVSPGQNLPVDPNRLLEAFGRDRMQGLAQQNGMELGEMLSSLSQHLPQVVDQLTPQGRMPHNTELQEMLGSLLGGGTRRA